ncbi:hypothetical protein [Erwinia aphidicola]|uniref:hypothetical protein n=1 Tax=Erwinia aphidicola TaxID=68334 RepID=UPI003CEEE686
MEFNKANDVPVFNILILMDILKVRLTACTLSAQALYKVGARVEPLQGATAFLCRSVFSMPGRSKKMIDPYRGVGVSFRKYLFSSWHVGPHLVSMKGIHFAVQDN